MVFTMEEVRAWLWRKPCNLHYASLIVEIGKKNEIRGGRLI
jgi:hypothetical protein